MTSRDLQTKYGGGYITPTQLRELGAMSHTKSEQSLASSMLKRWLASGEIEKVKKGTYRFVDKTTPQINLAEVLALRLFRKDEESGQSIAPPKAAEEGA